VIILKRDVDSSPVGRKLSKFNSDAAGDPLFTEVLFSAVDEHGSELGAVLATKDWAWLNIQVLFVEEKERCTGVGSALLAQIEKWGTENGCNKIHLDTFTFQAVAFYERRGYKEFGRLKNFPSGHDRVFMMKVL
jgi:GNAT superfamily N-acetyltransferase